VIHYEKQTFTKVGEDNLDFFFYFKGQDPRKTKFWAISSNEAHFPDPDKTGPVRSGYGPLTHAAQQDSTAIIRRQPAARKR